MEGPRLGVEPICRALQVAPSSYYAAKTRPPSPRACRDAVLIPQLVVLDVCDSAALTASRARTDGIGPRAWTRRARGILDLTRKRCTETHFPREFDGDHEPGRRLGVAGDGAQLAVTVLALLDDPLQRARCARQRTPSCSRATAGAPSPSDERQRLAMWRCRGRRRGA